MQLRAFPRKRANLYPYFFLPNASDVRKGSLSTTTGALDVDLLESTDLEGSLSLQDPDSVGAANFQFDISDDCSIPGKL